jgi:hypothetical protein
MTTEMQLYEVTMAQKAVNRTASEAAQLRAENKRLRKRLAKNSRYGKLLSRARDDARTLILWRADGFFPSRSFCLEQGMSERRHGWAKGLLKAARLWEDGDIVDVPLDVARRQLDSTVRRLQASDDDRLLSVRAKMPRKYRYQG